MLIIDGHNLIPTIPGMALGELDVEERLVGLLQVYARVRRKRVEVFFDGAPAGYAGDRSYGMVRAHFVRAGSSADAAIHQYLLGLKKSARNATVVTSDRQVQAEARRQGAAVIPSDEFARGLLDMRAGLDFQAAKARGRRGAAPAQEPPAGELDQWYDLFGIDSQQAEKPIPLAPKKTTRPAKAPRTADAPGKAQQKTPRKAADKPVKPRKHHGFPKKKE
jgi:hypothetical protein